MNKKFLVFILAGVVWLFGGMAMANNIQVSNISLTGENTTDNYVMVQFDLSWENSWRFSNGPANWDAAWIFVKYRVGSGEWQHAWLNDAGHNAGTGSGATIDAGLLTPGSPFNATTNPALGAFIYRSANGTGNFGITGAKLRWNYGANGVADNATLDIKVFAIEMAYVPQGAFAAGSGGSETSAFTLTTISTADATVAPSGTGSLGGLAGGYPTGQTAPASPLWPNGYGAFYSMKYEITQQQYVDFLNTLTATQAANRYSGSSTGNRYGITVVSGVYSTSNPFVACNFLSWMDGAAYSDWAGLRPMTELEFEKACRGTAIPVANEYAWGTATATAANNITDPGAGNETTNTSDANAVYGSQSNVQGPMRVGVFAKSGTTRAQSGASYWGIMELSGNLYERPVTVGNTEGRAFTGVHGNGALSANGYATETAWPGFASGEVTGATGSGFRGGDWSGNITTMRVSDRSYAVSTLTNLLLYGFRSVRSFPAPFACGASSISVQHTTAGGVAPVDKTVTYGTVTNIPGETSKCWITKNLGATQQATAVNDATEPSAGWYWQFNRKQGYKHDGTTRTPNTTWITNINQNSDWQTANDPCTLELGSSWRLPTSTEWTNVDGSSGGNWTNWNGPWNSGLKMHAAGYLLSSDGSLYGRGIHGIYWSSTQYSSTYGWYLDFGSGYSGMYGVTKANGYNARCVRDN